MEKHITTYRNDSTRLKNRDYGAPRKLFHYDMHTKSRKLFWARRMGAVFVGTQNFESLQTPLVQLTPMGKIAHQYWIEIPNHFLFVVLDEFVIMPNHVHGILLINKPDYRNWKSNAFGPQSQNVLSVLRGYKAATKKYATINGLEFSWQPRYHERILRLDESDACRKYIQNNPENWMAPTEKIIEQTKKSNRYEAPNRKNQ